MRCSPLRCLTATWRDWYLSVGVAAEEIEGDGTDRLVSPDGNGVAIWFQPVPEDKSIKNRRHLDLRVSRGREVSRAQRRASIEHVVAQVRAPAAAVPSSGGPRRPSQHVYAVMTDPEGNEFYLD